MHYAQNNLLIISLHVRMRSAILSCITSPSNDLCCTTRCTCCCCCCCCCFTTNTRSNYSQSTNCLCHTHTSCKCSPAKRPVTVVMLLTAYMYSAMHSKLRLCAVELFAGPHQLSLRQQLSTASQMCTTECNQTRTHMQVRTLQAPCCSCHVVHSLQVTPAAAAAAAALCIQLCMATVLH
jgi:hypothetical protein